MNKVQKPSVVSFKKSGSFGMSDWKSCRIPESDLHVGLLKFMNIFISG